MSTVATLKCSCNHDYQDSTYGSNIRVHNINSKLEPVCTVCGSKKSKIIPETKSKK